jgi:hypothetical protein
MNTPSTLKGLETFVKELYELFDFAPQGTADNESKRLFAEEVVQCEWFEQNAEGGFQSGDVTESIVGGSDNQYRTDDQECNFGPSKVSSESEKIGSMSSENVGSGGNTLCANGYAA